MRKPQTIDEYIAQFPADVQKKLKSVRATIRKAAPKAEEGIGYGVAAFKLNGPLIYFAAFKNHIGIYPRAKTMDKELEQYIAGKGTYQFPHDEKLPLTKITKLVKARMRENSNR